ncbi:MAG: phenylacetic acid degradation protein [Spirochaetes bacterium GWF1_51_8]|nr:MAG: phenylacetic acid degradation protein [Spirochaetes bacterium GWF1_51_8]
MDDGLKEKMLRYFNKKDKFCDSNGIVLTDISEGYAKAEMTIGERHYNSIDTVHGGALFALADFAFAAASNSHGTVAVGIHTDMSFVKALSEGTVYAEARERTINPKIANYDIELTDGSGDTVAVFHGMVYRKQDPLKLD